MQQIETSLKTQVAAAIREHKLNFAGSENQHSKALNINNSVYSLIKNGKIEGNILSKGEWIRLARELDVQIGSEKPWKTARTAVYEVIFGQMNFCAENSQSAVFCDEADIGKTHTAKDFVKRTKNAVYVDCSQCKTKQLLIRTIAKQYGIDPTGKYQDCKNNLVYYIKTLDNPLIALDEFGDLNYDAFLEIKALWNATEGWCGWYVLGADGLKVKIERGRNCKKVGFTEFFSRFGKKYQSVVPAGKDDKAAFYSNLVGSVLKANLGNHAQLQVLVKKCNDSLRRVKIEVIKLDKKAA